MARLIIRLVIVLGIPILFGIATFVVLRSFFMDPYDPNSKESYLVELKAGESFGTFTKELEAKGIIRKSWILDISAQLKKADKGMKAGEYRLSPSMSPQVILGILQRGEVFKRMVTIIEGMDLWDIADRLEAQEIISAEAFLKAAKDPSLLTQVDIDADSLEGYLFPETYHFTGKQTPLSVVWTLYGQFLKEWKPEYTDRLKELNLSRHEIITLASIIEKESGNTEEQPLISSVFYNRLREGMRLDSDPTLVYGLKDFNGRVLNVHKEIDSPYNTYKNFGLPPGPICNPGVTAIEAALYPSVSDYLFFVATGVDGKHVFTTNLKDHNVAVRNYRNALKARKKKNKQASAAVAMEETEQLVEDSNVEALDEEAESVSP